MHVLYDRDHLGMLLPEVSHAGHLAGIIADCNW